MTTSPLRAHEVLIHEALGCRVVVSATPGCSERQPRELDGQEGTVKATWGRYSNFVVRLDNVENPDWFDWDGLPPGCFVIHGEHLILERAA